jgi:hypothetical protein
MSLMVRKPESTGHRRWSRQCTGAHLLLVYLALSIMRNATSWETSMNWSMGSDSAQLWIVLLCTVVALAIATGIFFLLTWKRGSVDKDPLPHCNLEERLTEIAQSTMLQAKKTA